MGGMFGAMAIMAALRQRDLTGVGQHVQSGLFENAAWLVSTHMLQHAVSGVAPVPMSAGKRAWGVYDIFDTQDGRELAHIERADLDFLIDVLEEESSTDRDYYIDLDTLDYLAGDGKDGRPLGKLREWGLTCTQIHGGMPIGDRDTPKVSRRARVYLVPQQTTVARRQLLLRAAVGELELLRRQEVAVHRVVAIEAHAQDPLAGEIRAQALECAAVTVDDGDLMADPVQGAGQRRADPTAPHHHYAHQVSFRLGRSLV